MIQNASLFRIPLIAICSMAVSACGVIPQAQGTNRASIAGPVSAPVSAPRPVMTKASYNADRNSGPLRPRNQGGRSGGSGICQSDLGKAGARFDVVPDQYFGAGCTNLNTVRLASIRGDNSQFSLSNIGPLECSTAKSFQAWARYGVDRAARQILGSPLERIETMGTYSCRNVAGSSRRSAHATAEAIDVSAFVLADGRRISLAGDWDGGSRAEKRFLRTVQASACKRFGTVLGPDYNAAHRDHFHMERSDSKFCR